MKQIVSVCLFLISFAVFPALSASCCLAQAQSARSLMLADFEEDDVLKHMSTSGVTVSLTDKDVVTGKRALEVRVRPFSVHKNHWPRVLLGTNFFQKPIDASTYSKIVVTIRNVTEGLPPVKLSMTSLTYNDGGRNGDDMAWYVPEGESMLCAFPLASVRLPMNDTSLIRMLMFVFPDNEIDAVYRIDAIRRSMTRWKVHRPNAPEACPVGQEATCRDRKRRELASRAGEDPR